MILNVSISQHAEEQLRVKAAFAGVDLATYVSRVVEVLAKSSTSDEAFALLRDEFDRSGMSEEQLVGLLEEVKHKHRVEKRARKAS